jgi:uracil-DNA glycosylase
MQHRKDIVLRALDIPVWRQRGSKNDAESAAPQVFDHTSAPHLQAVDTAAPAADAAALTQMDWPQLEQAVRECTRCGLCKTRTQTVFGVGSKAARWMIVGEAPGAEEDARGEPFVGQAGRLLSNMLASVGVAREQVYVANVLKCRPPGNRNPEPHEVAQCTPYLEQQIALLKPALILVLGRFAAQSLLGTDASIASLRGKVHAVKTAQGPIPAIVSYHPAYLLRSLPEKSKSWADLLLARQTVLPLG